MESRKRSYDAETPNRHSHSKKKHRPTDHEPSHQHQAEPTQHGSNHSQTFPHADTAEKLPPSRGTLGQVSPHVKYQVPPELPPLPPIDESLSTAPFTHKSSINTYDRTVTSSASGRFQDVTYERLEFLGDAYLELFASRLIWDRFYNLSTAGQMSQLRELLVKNETLSDYSRAYGFDKLVKVGDLESMQATNKSNKGFNKVLGDVFEAYVAAVVLSDPEHGFAVAEKWLFGLWAPKLYEVTQKEQYQHINLNMTHEAAADPLKIYNPCAKADLQRQVQLDPSIKLQYETYQDSVELKGEMLGQNRHFIALYLTGYGHERLEIGRGEGKNKVEAGNWAATNAMHGQSKATVGQCAEECQRVREERRRAKESAQGHDGAAQGNNSHSTAGPKLKSTSHGGSKSKDEEKAAMAQLLLQTAAKQDRR